MSWFEKPATAPAGVPRDTVWAVCPSCKAYIGRKKWLAADKVCPRCNYHERLASRERIAMLTDSGSFQEFSAAVGVNDPLGFTDASGSYADKAKAAADKTGAGEAVSYWETTPQHTMRPRRFIWNRAAPSTSSPVLSK